MQELSPKGKRRGSTAARGAEQSFFRRKSSLPLMPLERKEAFLHFAGRRYPTNLNAAASLLSMRTSI
jgi:hypothetical protein